MNPAITLEVPSSQRFASRRVCILALLTFVVWLPCLTHADDDPNKIVAQLILKDDGSRMEVVRNPQARTLEMTSRDGLGNISRRDVFKLNAAGDPVGCQTYDASGKLIYRVKYAFDDMGRKIEEATYNKRGKMVRRVKQRYDSNGKALKPVEETFQDTERQPMAPIAPELTPHGLVPQQAPSKKK